MDQTRKRTLRFTFALIAACILATLLVYTSFSASSEARSPSQMLSSAKVGKAYEVTGTVQNGTVKHSGTSWDFRVRDRTGNLSIPVHFDGTMPDPFREGREVVVSVKKQETGNYTASKVVTKCPSKFTAEKS